MTANTGAEIETALWGGFEACGIEPDELGDANRDSNLRFIRGALEAVEPLLRERLAQEVEAERYESDVPTTEREVGRNWGLEVAARIIRGDSPPPTAPHDPADVGDDEEETA